MRNRLQVNDYLILILVLFLVLLAGCRDKSDLKTEIGISSFSYPNPDGDMLAVLVGSKVKGKDRPAVLDTNPVLLKFNDNFSLNTYRKIDDWVFRDMAWNPVHGNRLYYATFEKLYESDSGKLYEQSSRSFFGLGAGQLLMLDSNSDDIITISQKNYPNILSCFRWSPDGKILAGLARKPESQRLNSGELAVSFDGGKTSELTGINISSYPVWLNNKEIYVKTDNKTIARVLQDGQDFKISEILEKDCEILLNGSFQKKPVLIAYPRKDVKGNSLDKLRRLFVGNKLIYETGNPYLNVITFADQIIVEADQKVLIYDKSLSLVHEKSLKRRTHLLNFQPNINTVFLVRDWKKVLCYDYTKNEKMYTLFSVDMLER